MEWQIPVTYGGGVVDAHLSARREQSGDHSPESRDALGPKEGDAIAFSVENGQAVLRKAPAGDMDYLKAVESTLSEWSTPEDAFRDL